METPRINELIAQVVVWHNRHRLARRITSEHVRAIGVVVLPFVVPETTGKPTVKSPVPAFSEDFIAPLTPKQVSSFALKHGSREQPGAASWSQRVVPVDAGHESADLTLIYLRTACIELGDHRCRLLIGDGTRPKILGPRAWSVPRIAAASAAATAAVASVVMTTWLIGLSERPEVVLASVSAPASAVRPAVTSASGTVSMSAPLPAAPSASAAARAQAEKTQLPVAASVASSVSIPVSASASASAIPALARAASAAIKSSSPLAAVAAVPPASAVMSKTLAEPAVEVAPASRPRKSPLAVRPELSSEVRAAALLEGRRLRALGPAPTSSGAASAPGAGHVYAVMTASTRTRAMAERGHLLMDSSASAGEFPGKPRSDLMQVAGGWRAVLWPFRSRDDAKVAQAMLSERGVRTEVLEF